MKVFILILLKIFQDTPKATNGQMKNLISEATEFLISEAAELLISEATELLISEAGGKTNLRGHPKNNI